MRLHEEDFSDGTPMGVDLQRAQIEPPPCAYADCRCIVRIESGSWNLKVGPSSWTLSPKPLSIPNSGIHGQCKCFVIGKKTVRTAIGKSCSCAGSCTRGARNVPKVCTKQVFMDLWLCYSRLFDVKTGYCDVLGTNSNQGWIRGFL